MKKKIQENLNKALLLEGIMEYELYQYELEEHIDSLADELNQDKEDFVFVVTEKENDVAMVLITKNRELYINEEARSKLKELWKKAYSDNINLLLPMMANDLSKGLLSITGVKITSS